MKKHIIIFALIVVLISTVICMVVFNGGSVGQTEETGEVDPEQEKYNRALDLIDEGNHEEAYLIFKELGSYSDCKRRLGYFSAFPAEYRVDGECQRSLTYDSMSMAWRITEADYFSGLKSVDEYIHGTAGRMSCRIQTSYDGSVVKTEYTYDGKGNLIKETEPISAKKQNVAEHTYDANGNRIQSVYTYFTNELYIYDYTYDVNGHLIKETYTERYDLRTTTDYTYDESGNLIREVHSTPSAVISTDEFTYDASGNLTEERFLTHAQGDEAEYCEIFTYTYGENGKKMKLEWSDSLGDSYFEDYSYDENGKILSESRKYASSRTLRTDYTYDEDGYLVKKVTQDSEGGSSVSEYTYQLLYVPYTLSEEMHELIWNLN